MTAIKVAIKFTKNDFTNQHVIVENKEKMYVDSETDKSFTVIYDSIKAFTEAKTRWRTGGICMSYKELSDYIVDICSIHKCLVELGFVPERKKRACCH